MAEILKCHVVYHNFPLAQNSHPPDSLSNGKFDAAPEG